MTVPAKQVPIRISHCFMTNLALNLILFELTLIRHLNLLSLGGDLVERLLAVGTGVLSLQGPFFDTVLAEYVVAALDFGELIIFHIFDANGADSIVDLSNRVSD